MLKMSIFIYISGFYLCKTAFLHARVKLTLTNTYKHQNSLHSALFEKFHFCFFDYDKCVYNIWYDQLTVILDAILDLKTMKLTVNLAFECVSHHHYASIIILISLHFVILANVKIDKTAAKLFIVVVILHSILDL